MFFDHVIWKLVNVKSILIYKMLTDCDDLDFVIAEKVISDWIVCEYDKKFSKNVKKQTC